MYNKVEDLPRITLLNGEELIFGLRVCLDKSCPNIPDERPENLSQVKKSWVPKCRGLCNACYVRLLRKVGGGKTWAEFEKAGMCIPEGFDGKRTNSRKKSTPTWFRMEFPENTGSRRADEIEDVEVDSENPVLENEIDINVDEIK